MGVWHVADEEREALEERVHALVLGQQAEKHHDALALKAESPYEVPVTRERVEAFQICTVREPVDAVSTDTLGQQQFHTRSRAREDSVRTTDEPPFEAVDDRGGSPERLPWMSAMSGTPIHVLSAVPMAIPSCKWACTRCGRNRRAVRSAVAESATSRNGRA
jgi:hypothetical protein